MSTEKKTNGRGKLFYKLWGAFLITTFVCAIIITFQYIRSLHERETQLERSYSQMAVNVSGNLGSLVEQFEQYGRVLVEDHGMEDLQNVISASTFPVDSAEAQRLWERFNIFFNSSIQGGGNVAFLYLSNSQYILESTSYQMGSDSIEKINERLGLSEECWDYMTHAGEEIRSRLEKTEDMSFSRLMLAKEIYPDVVLILCIAEDNVQRAISSSYLPVGTDVCLVTQNDQAESFRIAGDHALEDTVYKTLSFEDAESGQDEAYYQYSIPLADDTIKTKVSIPDTWQEENSQAMIQSVLTALLIWFVCGGIFSYLLSTRLYQPVEDLMGKLPVKRPLSRKSQEFQLLHRTLQNLSEKNELYK